MHDSACRPIGPRVHEQPFAAQGDVRVIRDRQLHELLVDEEKGAAAIEIEVFHDEVALESGRVMVNARNAEVARCYLVHQRCLGQGLTAAHTTDRAWITGLGHTVGPEVGAEVDGVAVDPRIVALGCRHNETVRHKAAARQVELAHHHGITTVRRKGYESPGVVVREQRRSGEHPLCVLVTPELVDIEQQLPVGVGRAIAVERGAPPEASRMLAVPPEVVIVSAASTDYGNAIVGVDHLEQPARQFVENGRSEPGQSVCRLLGGPREWSMAVNVFEPEVLVGHRASLGGSDARSRYEVSIRGLDTVAGALYSSSASSLGSSSSLAESSSTFTSLNVSTRTDFTNRSER